LAGKKSLQVVKRYSNQAKIIKEDFNMDRIIEMVDEMLKNPNILTKNELDWVKKMDKTASGFKTPEFTTRQCEVITDIYKRFNSRK